MIDEYPFSRLSRLFASGNNADARPFGIAREGIRPPRSDRGGLEANGVDCAIEGDDLIVRGGAVAGGGVVETHLDHRIAMSFLVMGLAAQREVTVDDRTMIATSFPTFRALMEKLGARFA